MDTKKLRKAFYNNKMAEYVDQFLAGEPTEEEAQKLQESIEHLEKERRSARERFRVVDIKEMSLPGVEELTSLTEQQLKALDSFALEVSQSYNKVMDVFKQIRSADVRGNTDQYLNWAFELLEYQYDLDRYRVYKDQMYRARLVKIKDMYGCSRAEAEERAKLTPEYREYKKSVLFRELVEEAIMLAKKKYSVHM